MTDRDELPLISAASTNKNDETESIMLVGSDQIRVARICIKSNM